MARSLKEWNSVGGGFSIESEKIRNFLKWIQIWDKKCLNLLEYQCKRVYYDGSASETDSK